MVGLIWKREWLVKVSEERVYSLNTVNGAAHICIYIFFNLNKCLILIPSLKKERNWNPVINLLKPSRQVRFVLWLFPLNSKQQGPTAWGVPKIWSIGMGKVQAALEPITAVNNHLEKVLSNQGASAICSENSNNSAFRSSHPRWHGGFGGASENTPSCA